MLSAHTMGTKSYARFKEDMDKVKDKMQTQPPTAHDSFGPNDILSQVLEDKPYYSRAYGLGHNWGNKNSIVKNALEAKKNAEEKTQRVEEKLEKVLGQQEKILALLHKENPNLDLDEIIDSPNENDVPDIGESDELGTVPLLPMLQSSTAIPETQPDDTLRKEKDDSFFNYMVNSYQVKKTGVVKPL
ncbi:unnamed protein product [Linum trigynum]|uniref:Uncharacterized protein n=1 Tax=Linum trigynum TaxID=586398 RepID=A0AAV2EVV8_9ROSI